MSGDWLGGERRALALLALFLGTLYFGCFNHDFSVDGLRYATQVEQGGPLFHPNHLLPNALFRLAWRLVQTLGFPDVRAIWVMQALNALLGIATALCLARALAVRAGVAGACATAALYALGFAAWSFAQEPEVYVLPAFAVAASLAVLWRAREIGWARLSVLVLLAAFAALCLQQYVLWYPALLLLLWRADLGVARRGKLWGVALAVPLLCLAAYLWIGAQQGAFADRAHTLAWFLGYGWDAQHGFGTYRAAPALPARVAGLLLGLGNLALAYEVLLSPWAMLLGALAACALAWRLARAARVLWRERASTREALPIALWLALNALFALWWESRDIEFLLPVWLAALVLLGLARLPWRGVAIAAALLGAVNLATAFAPQRDWPLRYRTALALVQRVPPGANDALITDELNTVGWLQYFHGVDVRFLPGAVSAAMHADQPVAQARAALDAVLAAGGRVHTTELDERGRLFAIARWFGVVGRRDFHGVERELGEFYRGLRLRPGPVPGTREVLPAMTPTP